MEKTKQYDQIIVDKISLLINPEYLKSSSLILQIKADKSNSIRIMIDNSPWRNGVVKGNLFFANIKSSGKTSYINFKEQFAHEFRKLNIECTATETEKKSEFIRINLSTFENHLNNPSENFIKLINIIFLQNISFAKFGCCSKYENCKIAGKCLHVDQLYATACQYQNLLKRIDKFE